MSNRFWGWGREDDEFYRRIRGAGLQVTPRAPLPPSWPPRGSSLPSDDVPGAWRWHCGFDPSPTPLVHLFCRMGVQALACGLWQAAGPQGTSVRARAPRGHPEPAWFVLLSYSAPRESQLGIRHFATFMTRPGGRGTRSASQLKNRYWPVL